MREASLMLAQRPDGTTGLDVYSERMPTSLHREKHHLLYAVSAPNFQLTQETLKGQLADLLERLKTP